MANPRAKSRSRIGLVKFFGQGVRRRRFIHPYRLFETSQDNVSRLRHQIAADRAAGVGESIFEAGASGVQQQPRRLDGITTDNHRLRFLEMCCAVVVEIMYAGDASLFAQFHSRDHASVANLRAIFQSVGNMRDQRAGLRTDLAALNAEAAIDAVRPVSMRTGENGNRAANRNRNVERGTTANQRVADAAHGMRSISVSMRMSPRIVGRASDRHFQFQLLVIRKNILIRDGPVDAHAVAGIDFEV